MKTAKIWYFSVRQVLRYLILISVSPQTCIVFGSQEIQSSQRDHPEKGNSMCSFHDRATVITNHVIVRNDTSSYERTRRFLLLIVNRLSG